MTSHMEDPPLARLTTNTQQTWQTNSSNSSSSSATRYALDVEDHSPILVYRWNDGLSIEKTTQHELCQDLDRNRNLRVTKKLIPKRTSYVEVKRHDLFMPYEQEKFRQFPNYDSSLASIRLPSNIYWSRNLFGSYDKLFIVSPEMSPANSPSGSFADSDGSGKTDSLSFPHHEDMAAGAEKD
ncbi:hypothetical protein C1H76_6063 [Elsinoe australis]|uniref:Uncharacterized protein n=1 Tax=Elsinoe australis TaxID=40998 RepID=A0A4U7B2M1_9PEZI|nr:hypothetical protein C1H76_6063 [Elsinoe australis]